MGKYKYIKCIGMDLDGTLYWLNLIQDYVDKYFPQYSTSNLKSYQQSVSLWRYYKKRIDDVLDEAKRLGITPDANEMAALQTILFPDGQDEVVRKKVMEENSSLFLGLNESDWINYKRYEEPRLMIEEGLKHAMHNLDMFYERRDAALEADGKLDNGLIPYDEIYREENMLPFAKENLIALYKEFGERLFGLSAHNGKTDTTGRELDAKQQAIGKICPGMVVHGLRFHDKEHDPQSDVRRGRALKSNAFRRILGLNPWDPIYGCVSPDDSLFVNGEIYSNGGIPVHIVPYVIPAIPTDRIVNPDGYAMARSIRPESLYREFDAMHLDGPEDKVLRKRGL